MRFLMLALTVILLNGCAFFKPQVSIEPCGPDDFIKVNSGAKISNTILPVKTDQPYTIETTKAGVWASLDCWKRLENHK